MPITAITGLVPEWYTPEQDGDDTNKTAFQLQPLNGMQYMEVMGHCFMNGAGDLVTSATGAKMALEHGLLDWKNLNDTNGQPVAFNKKNLVCVPGPVLALLASEIINRSSLPEDARKN